MGIAIIGTGFIADVHVEVLQQMGRKIDLVIGKKENKTKEFAERWNIENYSTNFKKALADNINTIHICTPPNLHYEMVKEAINNNKHIICEKPMCLDPIEAKELMDMAKEKKLVNAVNFNVRFHDNCKKAKEIIKNDLGKILLIHGSYLQEFHILPTEYSWRYNSHLAGPMRATTEIGSHWIDLSRYLTGLEIEAVSANFGKFNTVRYLDDNLVMHSEKVDNSTSIFLDSDDAAIISLKYANGAIGSILLSEISHGRNNKISIEVTGEKKSVWWNSEDPYTLNESTKFNGVTSKVNAFGGGFPNTFTEFFKNVYHDIDKGYPSETPNYPNFYDGYINVATCDAIYRSAKNDSKWTEVL